VDAENRCIPFIDKQVWGIGKCTLCRRILFFPVSTTHIPISKPHFFCFQILHFHIENTVMCNKGFETFVVVTSQPINGEASEARSHTPQTILIDKRLFRHLVNSRKIVFHALASIVAADLFVPLHTETGKATAVRGNHDIVVSGHNLHIPTVRPELAYRALRTTFAE
jgi:hypothetical protein